MVASVGLAAMLPFEVFLISYAVLGPLHYVTEIAWLHKKDYFIHGKKDWISLIVVCVIITTLMLLINHWPYFLDSKTVEDFLTQNNIEPQSFSDELTLWPSCLIFFAFASALILTFVKDWFWRINAFAFALFLVLLFKGTPNYVIIFGILLTTIIHVWIFTGIFILSGAMNSKNISNYASFLVFILCSLSFIVLPIGEHYIISGKALEIVTKTGLTLNQTIVNIFDIPVEKADLISSSNALKVQAFIAFSYTYHYLNWFSKVEVIKWHKVSKRSLILSGVIWLVSLVLYIFDYRVGASVLLFLSILHVFLEFPLNFHSIAVVTRQK